MQLVDFIKTLKGQRVTALNKHGAEIAGVLKFVDQHMNIILHDAVLTSLDTGEEEAVGIIAVRGSTIRSIQSDTDCQAKLNRLKK